MKTSTGQKWFDCAECHQEQEDHPLMQRIEMVRARFHVMLDTCIVLGTDDGRLISRLLGLRMQKMQEMF